MLIAARIAAKQSPLRLPKNEKGDAPRCFLLFSSFCIKKHLHNTDLTSSVPWGHDIFRTKQKPAQLSFRQQWDAKDTPQGFWVCGNDSRPLPFRPHDNSPFARHCERVPFYSVMYESIIAHDNSDFKYLLQKTKKYSPFPFTCLKKYKFRAIL